MQAKPKPQRSTGYVRIIERRDGPVFYAKLKLADGTQPQRRLGKVWPKRTRPPDGYLTRGMAEARLSAILAGDDPLVNIAPTRITFKAACDEWLDYIEHERKRRSSTVRDYRQTVKNMLVPAFGADTPIEDVSTIDVDAYRTTLVTEDRCPRGRSTRASCCCTASSSWPCADTGCGRTP